MLGSPTPGCARGLNGTERAGVGEGRTGKRQGRTRKCSSEHDGGVAGAILTMLGKAEGGLARPGGADSAECCQVATEDAAACAMR